jgi:hypothetical protein
MLSAMRPKKTAKWGVSPNAYRAFDSSWKKVCLEVGISEDDVTAFGGCLEGLCGGICWSRFSLDA